MRIFNRILFLLFALALLGVGAVLALFNTWRTDRLNTLFGASHTAEISTGIVEFVQKGTGPFLLISHGTPGGYDQALAIGQPFIKAGFQVVAPSRPGYLRTPLSVALTPEDQADMFAALLTDLGIQKALLLGYSSGAPAILQFALRYPERTQAVLLLSPILLPFSQPTDPTQAGLLGRFLNKDGLPDLATWLLYKAMNKDPKRALAFFLQSDGTPPDDTLKATDFILNHPEQFQWFRAMADSYAPMSPRLDGLRNDLVQLRALESIPLKNISIPMLILFGENDLDINKEGLKRLLAKTPQIQVQDIPHTGQWIFLGPEGDTSIEAAIQFLKEYSP